MSSELSRINIMKSILFLALAAISATNAYSLGDVYSAIHPQGLVEKTTPWEYVSPWEKLLYAERYNIQEPYQYGKYYPEIQQLPYSHYYPQYVSGGVETTPYSQWFHKYTPYTHEGFSSFHDQLPYGYPFQYYPETYKPYYGNYPYGKVFRAY